MRDPFTEVSDILRAQLRDGFAPPGTLLVVTDVARTLQISPTPVREALGQLAGEGLIEVQRGRGARVRPLEAADLFDLYRLHALYVTATEADQAVSPSPPLPPSPGARRAADLRRDWTSIREETEAFFREIVAHRGNRVMQQALAVIADRLAIVRLVEGEVFDNLSQELAVLRQLALVHNLPALNSSLGNYHRRRLAAVPTLTSAVREMFRA